MLAPETLTSVNDGNSIVLILENHGSEPIYLKAGHLLGWIYDATVCPKWEINVNVVTSVDTLHSPTTVVIEMSVNTLIAGSDITP